VLILHLGPFTSEAGSGIDSATVACTKLLTLFSRSDPGYVCVTLCTCQMWGRFRHKVSRSRDSVPVTTYDERQDQDEVASSDLNNLSLRSSSDVVRSSSDADQAPAAAEDVTSSSSIVHGLSSNRSLGSLKNHQQFNGNHFLNNRVSSDTDMLNRFQTTNSDQEITSINSCVALPQNDNRIDVKYNDFEKYSHGENCNGYATDKSRRVGSDTMQLVEEMSRNESGVTCRRVSSSPPKLMRREKVKTGEVVVESRKSRLSCHLKNIGESVSSFSKPLELPLRQKLASCSLTPDDMQVDEAAFEAQVSGTTVCKKPNVMLGSRSASDGRMSTEPSTAESTDSGIQPSLCSGNDDKGLNSSGAEDDDPFSELFSSQNSDYMLLEDAKAMMASSLPASGGSFTNYLDHSIVERLQNTRGSTTADVNNANNLEHVSVDYVPYCESVTVLHRISHDSVDERKVGSKADYVPVDSSFAGLCNDQSLPVKQNGISPCVTRGTGTDDHVQGRGTCLSVNSRVSDYSSKSESTLNASMDDDRASRTGNMPVGFDIDSDDDSYLPPLPTRNYRKTSPQYVEEDMPVSSDMLSSHVSVESSASEERTHMSWEEVMKEAHALGIPLAAPRSETSDCKSSVSVASSDVSDCADNPAPYGRLDRMSSSEHSAVASSCAQEDKDILNTSQCSSPSKMSALAKCASPFKEKFRLHNLFSKKKSKKTDVVDGEVKDSSARIVQRHSSAAAEIQRRNLPPLPPKRIQAAGCNMSRSSLDPIPPSSEFSRPRAHRTLSTLTLPARDSASGLMTGSAWAGSSSSVGCQSDMSESGISSRSVSGIESHRDTLTQGNFGNIFVCIMFVC